MATAASAAAEAAAPEAKPTQRQVVHVRSAWGKPRAVTPKAAAPRAQVVSPRVIHVRSAWGSKRPSTMSPKATVPSAKPVTPRVVHVRSAWGASRPSARVPRASRTPVKAPVIASATFGGAPVTRTPSATPTTVRAPVMASVSKARSTAAGVGVSAPAQKIAIPSYVTAAVTGTATLASEAGSGGSDAETTPGALSTFLPPALAVAFVGACLALSHASAVIGAGLPLN